MVYFAFKYESAESGELLFLLDNFSVEGILTGIEMNHRRDNSLMIYPNPVTSNSQIVFEIEKKQEIDISIFNLYGQKIHTLVSGTFPEGKHNLMINSNLLSGGVYLCRLTGTYKSSFIKLIVE